MLPFSFPIPAYTVNAGVSALGQRKKGGGAEKKKRREKE